MQDSTDDVPDVVFDTRNTESPSLIGNDKPRLISNSSDENLYYCLKWNGFHDHLVEGCAKLFTSEEFADCTLACEGRIFKAHKIILAMSSTFFREIFLENPCKHPTVILKGMKFEDFHNVIQFIYHGKVNVRKEDIDNFVQSAESLKIEGLIKHRKNEYYTATTTSRNRMDQEDYYYGESDEGSGDYRHPSDNQSFHHENSSNNTIINTTGTCTKGKGRVIDEVIADEDENEYYNNSENNVKSEHEEFAGPLNLMHDGKVGSVSSDYYRPIIKLKNTTTSTSSTSQKRQQVIADGSDTGTGHHSPSVIRPSVSSPSTIMARKHHPVIVDSTMRGTVDSYESWNASGDSSIGSEASKFINQRNHTNSTSRNNSQSPESLEKSPNPNANNNYIGMGKQSNALDPSISLPSSSYAIPSTSTHQQQQGPRTIQSIASIYPNISNKPISTPTIANSSLTSAQLNFSLDALRRAKLIDQHGAGHQNYNHHHRHNSTSSSSHYYNFNATTSSSFPSSTFHNSRSMSMSMIDDLHFSGGGGSSSGGKNLGRPKKTKAIRSSQVPQSARYTADEVDAMVDQVQSFHGPLVPCSICQKFVKRERLRSHIHECHLLQGERIICPQCGMGLKSKGSYRVHIWRHKRGVLAIKPHFQGSAKSK